VTTTPDPDPWNPWKTLSADRQVVLQFTTLDEPGGYYLPRRRRGRATIYLDKRLGQVDRNAVLAHELLHHRDGSGSWDPDLSRRRCRQLWDEAAALLVPGPRLARLGWVRAEAGGTFDVWDVAEEFRVPEHVARRALHQLDPRQQILATAGWEESA
jgi:Zn-dependent peptidase ImmA (M78 family)